MNEVIVLTLKSDDGLFFSWPFESEEDAASHLAGALLGYCQGGDDAYKHIVFSLSRGKAQWYANVKR